MPDTIHDYSRLQADIRLWCARNDTDFVSALPEFIHMAEQRIFFGSGDPYPSDPVRVLQMKVRLPITFTNGVAPLPSDYLEQSSLVLDSDLSKRLTYRPEEEFDSLFSQGTQPSVFTIKGSVILVKPANTDDTDTAILTYYKQFPKLQNDTDTNDIMQNQPSIYLRASLIEAYSFIRNIEQRDEAYKAYIAAANGISMLTRKSLQGVRLSPTIPGTNTLPQGARGF